MQAVRFYQSFEDLIFSLSIESNPHLESTLTLMLNPSNHLHLQILLNHRRSLRTLSQDPPMCHADKAFRRPFSRTLQSLYYHFNLDRKQPQFDRCDYAQGGNHYAYSWLIKDLLEPTLHHYQYRIHRISSSNFRSPFRQHNSWKSPEDQIPLIYFHLSEKQPNENLSFKRLQLNSIKENPKNSIIIMTLFFITNYFFFFNIFSSLFFIKKQ